MWQEIKKAKSSGVVTPKPSTIRHIVSTANLNHLTHTIYYEVNNATDRKYVGLGKYGESPDKRRQPHKIPDALLEARNIYVTGIQDSGGIGKSDK